MNIGNHCAFAGCNKLDFLPIRCRFCGKDFCEEHMTPERHDCPSLPSNVKSTSNRAAPASVCTVADCKTPKGAIIVCDKCELTFCLPCRLPETHGCVTLKKEQEAQAVKNSEHQAADEASKAEKRAHLESLNLGSTSSTSSEVKKTPKKKQLSQKARERAAKVKVMKLRGSAKGPGYVAQADRVYFEANFNDKDYLFFVDRNYTVGRVRELFKTTFKLAQLPTEITTVSDYPLEPEATIKSLIEMGVLLNGDVINFI